MKLSRDLTLKIAFLIDEFIPPFLRDAKWFMYLPLKFFFGEMTHVFLQFKEKSPFLSEKNYVELYKKIDPYLIKRDTCLNQACVNKITRSIKGVTVLEAGCGNAYLVNKLAKRFKVTGADILIDDETLQKAPGVKFVNANIEHLPFVDQSFDTVICTHTLEHVLDINSAIKELRRVTRKRLIIVVPKQRPYRYTFDLHLHFFPYLHSFLNVINNNNHVHKKFKCQDVGGDIYYQEDKK